MNFFYTYDNRGNIISEMKNSITTTYEYDALGQLTRVNDPNDPTAEVTGTTWVYAYDRGGNILHKTAYNYTTEALPETYVRRWHYTYADNNWKDKLTAFDSVQITYDAIGNPLNDGTWTYTWEKGRQLKSMHNAATGVTMEFAYNHEGIRTQKVKKVNDEIVETTDYLLYGKKIIRMTKGSDTLLFHYDESGTPIMMRLNGTPYTYAKNLQGDIVGLIDSTGALVVEYKYDAWGNPISTRTLTTSYDALAELNPFRYRGYVWDGETDMFYLNNRYYVSHISRFLNADHLVDVNLFAYCLNNPVNRQDTEGSRSNPISNLSIMKNKAEIHDRVARDVADAVRGEYERAFTKIEGAGLLGGPGYADVVTLDHVWEIKPLSLYGFFSGMIQINRYAEKSGKSRGYQVTISPFQADYLGKTVTVLTVNGQTELDAGVIYYYFADEDDLKLLNPAKIPVVSPGKNMDKNTDKNEDNAFSEAFAYAFGAASAYAIFNAFPSVYGRGFGASGAEVAIFP